MNRWRALVFACVVALAPGFAPASFYASAEGRIEVIRDAQWRLDEGGAVDALAVLRDARSWHAETDPLPAALPKRIWARFDLPAGARRTVLFSTALWEHADYYVVQEGRVGQPLRTGTMLPLAQRATPISPTSSFMHPGFASVELEPGIPATIFVRLATEARFFDVHTIRFAVWDAVKVAAAERTDYAVQGLFFGVMLFLIFYNLGLFVLTREPSYIYYVLGEGGFTLAWAVLFGLSFEFLWPAHPTWDAYASWLGAVVGAFGLQQFLRYYLDLKTLSPIVDRFIRWSAYFDLALVPLFFIFPSQFELFGNFLIYSTPAGAILFVAVIVVAIRARHPLAWNLSLAITSMSIGIVLYAGVLSGLLPSHWAFVHASQFGSALMGTILSLGLGVRMRSLRDQVARNEREKLALIETQNRELESRVEERTAELADARAKAEGLLANILPRPIIDELALNGAVEPRRHEDATILFTDFQGFTSAVGTMPARRVVQELDEIFRGFDAIVARFGLEKIKTIGDAYMAAAGLPIAQPDHAQRCVGAGLALCEFIEERNRTAAMKWGLRVGVHSGAVVAGVVGRDKYAYDVWGDTVNIASRLESAGESGRVNISAYTFELVREAFDCEYRGKVPAKGKGEIDMYFVVAPVHALLHALSPAK